MTVAINLRIIGRVQGVWYRGWAVSQANEHGLSGWVRNRSDGSVEALAMGDSTAVDTFERRCREGPPMARVERIERTPTNWQDVAGLRQRSTV